jgi:CubicO group peptidase (beta-lactamase class C family)
VFDELVNGDTTASLYEDLRAVLVLAGGRPLVERYYDSSADATSNVASVTKSVMSILVGIALDEGAIGSVDQTLSELLPEYAAVMAPDVAAVTLDQVLTMTAGLPEDPPPLAGPPPYYLTEDWVAAIVSGGLKLPPGEGFAYASAGSHLLSAILVEATGQSVLDYARDKLFDPLGINTDPAAEPLAVEENLPVYEAASFAWPVDPQGVHLGDAWLKITAPDMAKIGQLMLAGGRWDEKQIVPAQWVTESTPPPDTASEATTTGTTGGSPPLTGTTRSPPPASEVSSSRSCPTSTSSSSHARSLKALCASTRRRSGGWWTRRLLRPSRHNHTVDHYASAAVAHRVHLLALWHIQRLDGARREPVPAAAATVDGPSLTELVASALRTVKRRPIRRPPWR